MSAGLKTCPPTWSGELLLACRKCQKKLRHQPSLKSLARLKKTLKRRNREHPDRPIHLINVPCMDVCPKHAVTVCKPSEKPPRLTILRSASELDTLLGDRDQQTASA